MPSFLASAPAPFDKRTRNRLDDAGLQESDRNRVFASRVGPHAMHL